MEESSGKGLVRKGGEGARLEESGCFQASGGASWFCGAVDEGGEAHGENRRG